MKSQKPVETPKDPTPRNKWRKRFGKLKTKTQRAKAIHRTLVNIEKKRKK